METKLKVEHTIRSYSGRRGCVCGCLGTHNDSERARKTAITQMLKSPAVRMNSWYGYFSREPAQGCLFIQTDTRERVLYLTAEGVKVAKFLGIKEEKN